ncbi:unnamed protein product [Calicophoron daubneyi]|uniref:bis(5'-adenosyl)-triphosphatase n=1 Tax=Calicophoron daubneyi TaxID=300641 RepID=A0AAV2TNV4_CALDB
MLGFVITSRLVGFGRFGVLAGFSCRMSTKVGVLQMCCTADKNANLEQAKTLISQAVSLGAKMVFLPECFDFIGVSREETVCCSEPLGGPLISAYRKVAAENGLWISLGGAHRKLEENAEDDRICNTHIVIDSKGDIACTYDKVHLFDVNIGSGRSSPENEHKSSRIAMMESKVIRPGRSPPPVVPGTPVGNLGIAICYDMRFPELAAHLRYAGGAHILTYPSAFSLPTGTAGHWHTLLRARAIENQCYVIAAAQEGQHNPKRSSYGHSLVIDAWGQIIAERLESGPGLLICDIPSLSVDQTLTASRLLSVRQSIPVEHHRRFDLFPMQDSGCLREIGTDDYAFGPHTIRASGVFYRSELSFAFVNISPLVPGHVLVSPVAKIARFDELTHGQVADLYLTVKQIAGPLAAHFNATSLTISTQDGKDAGQSVPHVHVHVLPRKPNDFPQNDDIYQALQKHDKVANRVYRTEEAMAAEAAEFRRIFYPN